MKREQPAVAIIILNWNGLEDTIECLESLKRVAYTNYRVIVVDNGSEGDDVRVLREQFADYVHIIENDRNYGFAEGNNIGMRYALADLHPDYVLLLNNDTVVDPGFLDSLLRVAGRDAKNGIIGPKIYYYDQPQTISDAGAYVNYWTGHRSLRAGGQVDSGQLEQEATVDYINGCCMLISRSVLSTVGLLDSRFFFWYEDVDYCIRAANRGFNIISAPKSKIWHKVSATVGRSRQTSLLTTYYITRNRFLLMEKHWTRPQFVTSVLCYAVCLPKYFVRFMLHVRHRDMLRFYLRGLVDYVTRKGTYSA